MNVKIFGASFLKIKDKFWWSIKLLSKENTFQKFTSDRLPLRDFQKFKKARQQSWHVFCPLLNASPSQTHFNPCLLFFSFGPKRGGGQKEKNSYSLFLFSTTFRAPRWGRVPFLCNTFFFFCFYWIQIDHFNPLPIPCLS